MTHSENFQALHPNILLVDDRPANLLALEAVLKPLGHRLVPAHSGAEALKRLLEEEFAVILMDVQMPALDGYQTERVKAPPSASGFPGTHQRGTSCNRRIRKPMLKPVLQCMTRTCTGSGSCSWTINRTPAS